MTKLFFIYSPIYNETLYKLNNLDLDKRKHGLGFEYSRKLFKEWSKHNDDFFKYYKQYDFLLPEVWNVYMVQASLPIIPFSHPLTMKMNSVEQNIGVLFHEMIHVFLHFNSSINKDISTYYDPLNKAFPNESKEFIDHLIVNSFSRGGMYSVLGDTLTKKYIQTQLDWKSGEINKAWQLILDKSP